MKIFFTLLAVGNALSAIIYLSKGMLLQNNGDFSFGIIALIVSILLFIMIKYD